MTLGVGVVLLALGATLVWGTDAAAGGVELTTVGTVLLILGGVALAAAVLSRRERVDPRER